MTFNLIKSLSSKLHSQNQKINFKHILLPNSSHKLYESLCNPLNSKPEENQKADNFAEALKLSPILVGRPTDTALFVLAGYTGAGKSSLINAIFQDKNLCPTGKYSSVTSDPVLINKRLTASCKDFMVTGNIAFVDVPGTGDTSTDRNASNLAKINSFLQTSSMLAPRNEIVDVIPEARPKVYPNIVLFVINGSNNRIFGDSTGFAKALEVLVQTENLLDTERPNLIIAVTHALRLGRRKKKFEREWGALVNIIQAVVRSVLGNLHVDIIPVENNGDDEDYDLETEEGYYWLPDGTLSHFNLISAILRRFDQNQDEIGKLLVSAYLNPNCSERLQPPTVTPYMATLSLEEIQQAQNALRILKYTANEMPLVCRFRNLGYGYDPVTEEVKLLNVSKFFERSTPHEWQRAMATNLGSKATRHIKVSTQSDSSLRQSSFLRKKDYENFKTSNYGFRANLTLSVDVKADGKWLVNAPSYISPKKYSFSYELQVLKFALRDVKDQIINTKLEKALNTLPLNFSDNTVPEFFTFIQEWGTHFIYEEAVGGIAQFDLFLDETYASQLSESTMIGSLKDAIKVLNSFPANFQPVIKLAELRKLGFSRATIRLEGGKTPKHVIFETLTENVILDWLQSIEKRPTELKNSIKLYPYYMLFDNADKYLALKEATGLYTSYKNYMREKQNTTSLTDILSREDISIFNTNSISLFDVVKFALKVYFRVKLLMAGINWAEDNLK